MRLLIVRHGIAEDHGPDGSDASRRLTEEGVARTGEVAAGLAKLVDPPEVILTSPKVRAAQTADILGKVFDLKPRELEALASGSPTKIMQELLRRKEESVLLVGHEPTLSQLVEQLCTGGERGGFIGMKKAGCACVEAARLGDGTLGAGHLHWLATPKMLRNTGD